VFTHSRIQQIHSLMYRPMLVKFPRCYLRLAFTGSLLAIRAGGDLLLKRSNVRLQLLYLLSFAA
jgi:hypothetical protein